MRFVVKQVTLSKKHPLWPGEDVFKILDTKTMEYRMSNYITEGAANEMCEKINRAWEPKALLSV